MLVLFVLGHIFADGPRENYIGKRVRRFCQRHGVIFLIKLNGARLGKKTPRKLKKFQLGNGGQKTNLQWSHVKLKSNGGSTFYTLCTPLLIFPFT